MKFSAVILAGGKSSRMGRDKAWLEVEGQSLLARQIQLVREVGANEVFVSGRASVDYSGFDCRVLLDRLVDAGPLGGIEIALDETSWPFLLVLAVDMPGMTAEFLRHLLSRCGDNAGVVPRLNGEIEPLVAIYPKAAAGLIGDFFSARKVHELSSEAMPIRVKSPRARAFAKTCVSCGLAKFVAFSGREINFFVNWNSPQDVE